MPNNPRDYGKRTREYFGFLDHFMERQREFKRKRFVRKLETGYQGPVILAEGDSWFEYPMADDLLMPLGERYAILSLAKAGNSFAEVGDQNELFPRLNDPPGGKQFHIVMLSLGGNEVMGRIEDFTHENEVSRADEDYLLPKFDEMLYGAPDRPGIRDKFDEIVGRIVRDHEQHVILHGYDYPDPRFPRERTEGPNGSQWIGPPLWYERDIGSLTTYREVVNQMLDKFNAVVAEVAGRPEYRGRVHYVNLRGTIGQRSKLFDGDDMLWADEIHGTTDGFRRLARQFEPVIDRVWEGLQVG
jgi:hypothetical protein